MEKQLIYFMFLTLIIASLLLSDHSHMPKASLQCFRSDLSQDLKLKPFICHRHLFSLPATLFYFSHFYHENTLSYHLLFRTSVAGTADSRLSQTEALGWFITVAI